MYAIRSYYAADLEWELDLQLEAGSAPEFMEFRITSYNVCYTKLLRVLRQLIFKHTQKRRAA